MDEAYVGGREIGGKKGRGTSNKTVVFGIKERGGRIRAAVVPDASMASLRKVVLENVKPGSIVSTDEHRGYNLLVRDGYIHGTVNTPQRNTQRPMRWVMSIMSILLRAFGACSRPAFAAHTFKSRRNTLSVTSTSFVSARNYREMGNAMFDVW